MRAIHLIQKVLDKIILTLGVISAFILASIMILNVYETGARYLVNAALGWAVEIPEYLLLMSTGLALAYTQKVGRHISVKILDERLSPKGRKILAIAVAPIYLAVAGGLFWGVTKWAMIYVAQSRVSFMVRFPVIIPQSFLVIGFAFLIIQVLVETIEIAVSLKSTTT